MQSKQIPSKKRYGFACVLLLIGITVFVSILLLVFLDHSEDHQMMAPGAKELVLKDGKYTIFYEHRSVIGGNIFVTDQRIDGLELSVVNKSTNNEVELISTNSASYVSDGREGISISKFTIDEPGTYELSAFYEGVDPEKEVVLVVKKSFVERLIFFVIGVGTMIVCTLLAVVLFIHTYIGRAKVQRHN